MVLLEQQKKHPILSHLNSLFNPTLAGNEICMVSLFSSTSSGFNRISGSFYLFDYTILFINLLITTLLIYI